MKKPAPVVMPTYGIARYRKRPVEVDALQWTGANYEDMEAFLETTKNGFFKGETLHLYAGQTAFRVIPGTWVIRGATGGYHPCYEESFPAVYEKAD